MSALSGVRVSRPGQLSRPGTGPERRVLRLVPAPPGQEAAGPAAATPAGRALAVPAAPPAVPAAPAATPATIRSAPTARPRPGDAQWRQAPAAAGHGGSILPARRAPGPTGLPAAPAPVRLTRRGRLVLGGLVIMLGAGVALLLLVLTAPGGALASNHGQPRAGYRGMTQIVVQPGQTLWSIAAAAEPGADPRLVLQRIISANALPGSAIYAGELLWVPKA